MGTETPGEGERRFAYELTWEVTGPDGESIGAISDRIEKTVPESADLSQVYLTVNFSPQTEFDEGPHTMEIEVTDAIADNTATETVEFEIESPLEYAPGDFEISTFAFTDGEANDYGDYTPKPDAEYAPDEIVWYYLELDGFAYEETDDALRHDLQIIETLTGPEGDVWSEAELPLNHEFEPSVDMDTYLIVYYFEPVDGWMTGHYTVTYEVTDRLTEESFTEEYTFTVVEGSSSS